MRVLIVGGGGREHALAQAIAASPLLTALYCAPGNPGVAALATLVPIASLDVPALVAFAVAEKIDLVVPGPEGPLAAGLADALAAAGKKCCGPTAAAARIESSKAFAHEVADAAGIPAALWERFSDPHAARDFVARRGAPIVVKADGLAAGKGVVVAQSEAEAFAAIDAMMRDGALDGAGKTLVIEECLTGQEVSVFALCDGTHAIPLGAARDHKRAHDGDTGPNTGGMGAYSPVPNEAHIFEVAMSGFIRPALAEMAARDTPFRGFLFAGLMLTADGPRLIEFNARLGDPEAQVILPRLRSDLLPAFLAACDGELGDFSIQVRAEVASVAVVMAARGYPGTPETGSVIRGLDAAAAVPGVTVFHAGTAVGPDGAVLAVGGRVLTVAATAPTVSEARAAAYRGVDAINWPEGFCRRDIATRAVD